VPLAASASRFLLRKYDAAGTGVDLTMAVVLQMVSPVDDRFIRLGPARRRAWTEPTLASEFADLVEWRDRLYAEERGS
jgi:glutathione S-transferase